MMKIQTICFVVDSTDDFADNDFLVSPLTINNTVKPPIVNNTDRPSISNNTDKLLVANNTGKPLIANNTGKPLVVNNTLKPPIVINSGNKFFSLNFVIAKWARAYNSDDTVMQEAQSIPRTFKSMSKVFLSVSLALICGTLFLVSHNSPPLLLLSVFFPSLSFSLL